MTTEDEIKTYNRVLGAISEQCDSGSKYHPEQAARDIMVIMQEKIDEAEEAALQRAYPLNC